MDTPTRKTEAAPKGTISRRRIVRAAVATAPFIATLPSGAALARSSNIIGAALPDAAKDSLGRTLCISADSGVLSSSGTSMDLGTPPSGLVTAITERDYRMEDKGSALGITEGEMCQKGGIYYYKDAGWQQTTVPRGMLVSATALSSFAGSVYLREV